MKNCTALIILFFCLNRLYAQPGDSRGTKIVKPPTAASDFNGNTYAIIIGISNYKNILPHLKYADRDAKAFRDYLLSDAGGKIPAENIETFLNEDAVKTNVGGAISDFVRELKPGDRIYFFFAGHGDMEDLTQVENGLLLLYNSPNGNYFGMNDDVLEILDLKRYLSPLSEKGIEVFFIIDACHSGNLKGGIQGIEQTTAALAAEWGKEFKILSCQPNQLSQESEEWGGGRGLFSFELEQGMEGLADKNHDGKITLFELQQYITDKVSSISDGTQIPLVTGDLSKDVAIVNPTVLAEVIKENAENYPVLAKANQEGSTDEYLKLLDTTSIKWYKEFEKNIEEKKLIEPEETNAMKDYRLFEKKNPGNALTKFMRRDLAAGLNEKFDSIVSPLLKGQISYSSREACKLVSVELDSCLQLLGAQHYMYNNIKARKLFIDAMALTWALTESEYNISLRPTVEKSIELLEQSEQLEPNAAYTLSALGTNYFYVYDYDKAFEQFQKYVDLRPKDFYARYSLANLFIKLKELDKAQTLLKELIEEYPQNEALYALMCRAYAEENNKNESIDWAQKELNAVANKADAYFDLAVAYHENKNFDSARYYYALCRKTDPETFSKLCDNNIGNIFLITNKLDSAEYYFDKIIKVDTTYPIAFFNLGTIDAMRGDYYSAINKFIKTIIYSPSFEYVFVSDFEIYFNKHYTVTDSAEYNEFKNKVFEFDIQYASYLYILYCYLRDPVLSQRSDKIELIFSRMKNYKEYDVYTYYYYACYKSLQKDKDAAIDNLKKSLSLGFGNYFMFTSDDDLAYIRNTPEFVKLLKQYFPGKIK